MNAKKVKKIRKLVEGMFPDYPYREYEVVQRKRFYSRSLDGPSVVHERVVNAKKTARGAVRAIKKEYRRGVE